MKEKIGLQTLYGNIIAKTNTIASIHHLHLATDNNWAFVGVRLKAIDRQWYKILTLASNKSDKKKRNT